MGQKDIAEKVLEAYNDVFADVVNVLLFDGKEVLKEDELEDAAPRSAYKADEKYREIERDVSNRWKVEKIRLSTIEIENQTKSDKDMPLRVLAYDGAEYRAQMNQDKDKKDTDKNKKYKNKKDREDKEEKQRRYPVVTLVLYFDHKKKWDQPLNLLECLDIPEMFRPYVNDYRVNLFDIAYLSPEQVRLFKSDFRFVADYFVQMRMTGDYKGNREEIKHIQETLSMMSILTRDKRFEDAFSDHSDPDGKEIKTMCDVLDRIELKGKAAGIAEGKAAGIKQGESRLTALIQILFADGRVDDVKRVAEDPAYKEELMKEFKIA